MPGMKSRSEEAANAVGMSNVHSVRRNALFGLLRSFVPCPTRLSTNGKTIARELGGILHEENGGDSLCRFSIG